MPRTTTKGRCYLCGQVVGKGAMTRHLQKCRKEHADRLPRERKSGKPRRTLHLLVDGGGPFWMHVEAADNAPLTALDDLLREKWLECCGHLSAFAIRGKRYSVRPIQDDWFGLTEEDMDAEIGRLVRPGEKFGYEYDFGSTTSLRLQMLDEIETRIQAGAVRLVARNLPPEWKCCECGQPATAVCLECRYESFEEALYCDECLVEHPCGDEIFLPVTNSPRCGACGYCGELDADKA